MDIRSSEYKSAFEAYIRKGIPIEQSLVEQSIFEAKETKKPTTHYIWRTRNDNNVRAEHAENNGKIFAWDDFPKTGHPGEDFGCRCRAEPYYPAIAESFNIQIADVADTGPKWSSLDFVDHYFFGDGKTITVRETGHLQDVVAAYKKIVIDDIERLPSQISKSARANMNHTFSYTFENEYRFTDVVFSLGHSLVKGAYYGYNQLSNGILTISGEINFHLRDEFKEPLGVRQFLGLENQPSDENNLEKSH